MAKKNGGLFGGLFDFNGDGKTDLGEEFIAYKIFEECVKGNDDTDDDLSLDDDLDLDLIPSKDYSWRSYCEDGSEFCVFPEDYETEEEYEEALNDAKYAWRNTPARTVRMPVFFLTIMKLRMNIPKHLRKPNTLGEIPVRTDRPLGLIPKIMKPKKNTRKRSMRQGVVGETLARREPMPVWTPITMTLRENTSRLLKKPKPPVAE